MMPIEDTLAKVKSSAYNVLVDGRVVGFVAKSDAPRIVDKLRILKVKKDDNRFELFFNVVVLKIELRVC